MKTKLIKLSLISVISIVLISCSNSGEGTSTSSPAPEMGTSLDLPVKQSLLDLTLINDKSENVSLNTFKGKILVITPIFTACDDICPLSAANFRIVQDAINKAKLQDKIQLLLITIDPLRDSSKRLAAYREKLSLESSISLLTGSEKDINIFWDGFGLAREVNQMESESSSDHHNHHDATTDADQPSVDWFTGETATYEIVHSDGLFFISGDQDLKFLRLGLPDVSNIKLDQATKEFLNEKAVAGLANPVAGGWQAEDVTRILSWLSRTPIIL